MRAARAALRRGRRLAVRQPDAVQRRRRPRRLPAQRGARRRRGRGARRRRAVRPRRRRDLPGRVRDHRRTSTGLGEVLEGAERGPEPLRRRLHRRHEAAQHRRARRRLLRPEGRAAGRRRCAAWCATSTSPVEIEVVPDRARAGRARAVEPQRPPRRADDRERARRAVARRCARPQAAVAAGERDADARSRRRAARPWAASSPSTSRSSTPTRFAAGARPSTAACSWPWPRASATYPPHRQHPHPHGGDPRSGRQPARRSACPPRPAPRRSPSRKPVTLTKLAEMRALGEPIVMVTAYDHPSARRRRGGRRRRRARRRLGRQQRARLRRHRPGHGRRAADARARPSAAACATPLLVGDLPFGSYEASDEQAIDTAHRFVKEAGCDAVKLEGGGAMAERARAIVRAGVPVMGHVGLTPQTATALGGYRAQGRTAAARPRRCSTTRWRCRRPAASRSSSRRSRPT